MNAIPVLCRPSCAVGGHGDQPSRQSSNAEAPKAFIDIWRATRHVQQGRFIWPGCGCGVQQSLTRQQLDALVLGRPWQPIRKAGVITPV